MYTEHPIDQIEAFLAGGLTPAESEAFTAHIAGCPACAGALRLATEADAALERIFAADRPSPDFEDRMIQELRKQPARRRFIHPAVRKVAVAAAAAVVLGGVGYVGNAAISGNGIAHAGFAQTISEVVRRPRVVATSNLRQIGSPMMMSKDRNKVTNDELVLDLRGQVEGLTAVPGPSGSSNGRGPSQRNKISSGADSFAGGKPAADQAQKHGQSPTVSYEVEDLVRKVPDFADAPAFDLSSLNVKSKAPAGPVTSFQLSGALQAGLSSPVAAPPSPGKPGQAVTLQWGDVSGAKKQAELSYYDPQISVDANGKSVRGTSGMSLGLDRQAGAKGTDNNYAFKAQIAETSQRSLVLAPSAAPMQLGQRGAALSSAADKLALDVKLGRSATEYDRKGGKVEEDVTQTVSEHGLSEKVREVGAMSNISLGDKEQSTPATPAPADGPKSATEQPNVPTPATPAPAPQETTPKPDPAGGRKIIRSGEMEFEVEGFDSAVSQITKIVVEEGGFVSTTESDKLPNGKVKGRVVLRCPPERLDTLVLKLRGIGDLHTQRIGAQDVTKQYTDIESALRAAHAMQDRLIEIIKTGKGAVKDLLEAEKQLGIWREKIEQLEGEVRYYNNLVSLSTLAVTILERDIKTPAYASETETVTMAVETEKVEDAYQKARDAVTEAKGRITASELKQFDAGQYRATVSAMLPPEAAEAAIARIRQIDGRLAHYQRERSQSTSNGNAARAETVRLKREDVVLSLTLYNLANIAPRRTTTLVIVSPNVEEAYRSLIDQVNTLGGRVITSAINRPRPDQTSGSVNFNVPSDKADVILGALRGSGEVLKSDTNETPDNANVTDSKRGFSVTIASLAAFGARETQQVQLAADVVPDAFNEVLNSVRGKGGRVLNSQLNEQDRQNVNGTIDFELPRDAVASVEQSMHHGADVISRVVTRSTDTENTVDTKVRVSLTVVSADRLPARETLQTQLAAADVAEAFAAIKSSIPKGGRILASELNEQDPQNISGHLIFDVPQSAQPAAMELLKKNTAVLSRQNRRIPEGQVAVERLRVELTLVSADRQPARQTYHTGVLVTDVQKAADDLVSAALGAGGRQSENPTTSQDQAGHTTSTIIVDIPADKAQTILDQIDHMGDRRTRQVAMNTQVPEGKLARVRIEAVFADSAASLGGQESMSDYVRNGLMTSLKGLGYSLMWIIIGVCLVAPWVLLIWGAVKLARRSKAKKSPAGSPA